MADNYLITGYWGEPHVTAENDRGINAAIFGTGRFVLPVGEQFRAEYIGNNTIRMYDGKLLDNGAAAGIPAGEYVDLLIANAGQGMKRNDLIVFQYEQDGSTLIESGKFVVIQGTETSGTASDPALTQQDLLSNEATFDQFALWRVPVSGTAVSAPEKIFESKEIATQDDLDKLSLNTFTLVQELNNNIIGLRSEDSRILGLIAEEVSSINASIDITNTNVEAVQSAVHDIVDYIVDKGTSKGWTYRKWASGIAECWGTFLHSSDINLTYPSSLATSVNLPIAFSEAPSVTFGITAIQIRRIKNNSGTSTSTISTLAAIEENYPLDAGVTISIYYDVKGRWK